MDPKLNDIFASVFNKDKRRMTNKNENKITTTEVEIKLKLLNVLKLKGDQTISSPEF